jgi:hypothetical protein
LNPTEEEQFKSHHLSKLKSQLIFKKKNFLMDLIGEIMELLIQLETKKHVKHLGLSR